jgi:hypothetical protein
LETIAPLLKALELLELNFSFPQLVARGNDYKGLSLFTAKGLRTEKMKKKNETRRRG